MQDNIFGSGVNPGSPDSLTAIKTLICYILSSVDQSISFMQLYDALNEKELVNYFDLVLAVEQLCHSGHMQRIEEAPDSGDRYTATALGKQVGSELTNAVPHSVREKALAAAKKVLRRERRASEVRVTAHPSPQGGFVMEFSIPDQGVDLLRFSLFVPTQEECDLMRKRFLNAPLFIYQHVLALLTGNRQVLGEMPHPMEDLF